MDEAGLLILIILLFGQHHQGLRYFIHIQLGRLDQLKEDIFFLVTMVVIFQRHGRLEAEGIEAAAKLQVFLQDGVADEVGVEQHFEQVVGVVVVEDNPLSVPTRVIRDPVDAHAPHADELGHVASKLPQVVDVLE